MPIAKFLVGSAFGPEDVKVLCAAFEDALQALGLVDRSDPAVEMIAHRIITLAKQGERDPRRLCDAALQSIRGAPLQQA